MSKNIFKYIKLSHPDLIEKISKEYPNKSDAEKWRLMQAEILICEFKNREVSNHVD